MNLKFLASTHIYFIWIAQSYSFAIREIVVLCIGESEIAFSLCLAHHVIGLWCSFFCLFAHLDVALVERPIPCRFIGTSLVPGKMAVLDKTEPLTHVLKNLFFGERRDFSVGEAPSEKCTTTYTGSEQSSLQNSKPSSAR